MISLAKKKKNPVERMERDQALLSVQSSLPGANNEQRQPLGSTTEDPHVSLDIEHGVESKN